MALRKKIIISASDQTATGFGSVTKRADRLDKQLERANSGLKGFFQLAGAGTVLGGLVKASDTVKQVNTQLKLATESEKQFAAANEFVLSTSVATGTTLKDNAQLYATLSRSSQALAEDNQRLERVQTTINQALVLGGRSTQENEAAIRQLTQGLASGVLRGDEFNSVMENSPRIQQIMQDALGKSTGELRKMAEEGQITSELVIAAFENQSSKVAQEMSTVEGVISRSFSAATQAATEYIGSSTAVSGANTAIADSLQFVAENFDEVANAAGIAGALIVSRYAGKGVAAINTKIAATFADIRSEQAKQAAMTKTFAAEVKSSKATLDAARAELTKARYMAQSTRTVNEATRAEKRLLAARKGLAAATLQSNAANASYVRSTKRVIGVAKGLRRAMGLLGGPAGIMTLVAIELGSWALNSREAAEETETVADRVDRLTGSINKLQAAEIGREIEKFRAKMGVLVEQMEAVNDRATAFGPLVSEREVLQLTELGKKYAILQKGVDDLEAHQKKLTDQNEEVSQSFGLVGGASDKAAQELEKYVQQLKRSVNGEEEQLTSAQKHVAELDKIEAVLAKGLITQSEASIAMIKLGESYTNAANEMGEAAQATTNYDEALAGSTRALDETARRGGEAATAQDALTAAGIEGIAVSETQIQKENELGTGIRSQVGAIDEVKQARSQLIGTIKEQESAAIDSAINSVKQELAAVKELTSGLAQERSTQLSNLRQTHSEAIAAAADANQQMLAGYRSFAQEKGEIDRSMFASMTDVGVNSVRELVQQWISIINSGDLRNAVQNAFRVDTSAFAGGGGSGFFDGGLFDDHDGPLLGNSLSVSSSRSSAARVAIEPVTISSSSSVIPFAAPRSTSSAGPVSNIDTSGIEQGIAGLSDQLGTLIVRVIELHKIMSETSRNIKAGNSDLKRQLQAVLT